MVLWTRETVEFLQTAAERTDYYPRLAQLLARRLAGARCICDAGCGIGSLALELAGSFESVTAADRSPEAIAALRQSIREKGIGNIECLQADLMQNAPEEQYDAMVFCFFAKTETILPIAKRQCRGKLAIVKKNYDYHRFSLQKHPHSDETADACQKKLEALHIPFTREDHVLECGQPFESIERAMRFFEIYDRGEASDRTEQAVRKQLIRTEDPAFPYYLPKKKEIGILLLNAEDLP